MAQNIDLLGAQYSDVPAVELPKVGGGTASFTDVTDTTAAAADVAQGKYFYTSAGVRTEGTSTGGGTEAGTVTQDANGYLVLDDDPPAGPSLITKSITANGTYNASSDNADGYSSVTVNVSGGGGLVYETGTWTPATDTTGETISFSNTHTVAPMYVQLCDIGETETDASSVLNFGIIDYRKMFGSGVNYGTSTTYGYAEWATKTSSSFTSSDQRFTTDTDNSSNKLSPYYWVTETGFYAYVNSSSRYFRANRTYKWISVWAPTS